MKNNREYNSINKEIEYEELSIELSKKRVKESEEKIDFIADDVKKVKKNSFKLFSFKNMDRYKPLP